MTPTLSVPERERTAQRLLDASEAHTLDPAVEVNWERGLLPDMWFLPPERCSLYGTKLWATLDTHARQELTRHELASVLSVGIWFELILMQMLIRDTYDQDPRAAHARYALTEIADECRHSNMFARTLEVLGTPAYGPGRLGHQLGRMFKATSTRPVTYAATLYIEAILDQLQRESLRDERIQPLVREVFKVHVVEEARHMRYAGEELVRQFTDRRGLGRRHDQWGVAVAAAFATDHLIHPAAYAAVGLDPVLARRTALANPQWRATRAWAARRVVADLDRAGYLSGGSRRVWARAGLLSAPAGG